MILLVEVLLGLSAIPPLLVLWRGPTLWDRLAGASSLNLRVALILAAHAALSGHGILLDVALAYAIFGFLGTVLVARFGERGER
ncbi:pH regulation protein F [Candidatus Bipolaricaulota bacterium]|nr:pH regulation protein F [Candidatus Bipolaricaulota bacterium]